MREIDEERCRLLARFQEKMRATPSLADPSPQGTGEKNRHGMPKEPPDQNVFEQSEWPVLDLGLTPETTTERWELHLDGAVEAPQNLRFADLLALPQIKVEADFHCVTGWSILDLMLGGVPFAWIAALARPRPDATHVMAHGSDGYSANLPLEEALKPDVLLVHSIADSPLTLPHGGPVRMVVPQLWAWKGAKWLNRIEFLTHDRRGYWEIRGYSNTAYPWRNDRQW
ncbi:MAG TPA: molybdopterin-dependent oxidoreductase [Anaeromyxobacteraceae bacterium]|nr:molybdopterin-dependent oxidoreductase [Anaeromyxobacteraceae bacterium]